MFPITYNATEYEALLASPRLVKKIQVEKLMVFVDSWLVVRQVSKEYEVKDPLLKKYNGLVKQLWENFTKIQLVKIPWEENTKADELSKLDLYDPKATIGILVKHMNQPSIAYEPR